MAATEPESQVAVVTGRESHRSRISPLQKLTGPETQYPPTVKHDCRSPEQHPEEELAPRGVIASRSSAGGEGTILR